MQILEIIGKNEQVQVKDLVKELGLTAASIHRALNKLMQAGQVSKKGSAPKVFYFIPAKTPHRPIVDIPNDLLQILEKEYLYISPTGNIIKGLDGFLTWMRATNNRQNIENCIKDYIEILSEANSHKNKNLIEATDRFNKIFSHLYLDQTYYYDFYSLIRFGKTKIGHYLHHGKQAQNIKVIKTISELIQKPLADILKTEKIDAIAWVPHSIPRKIPFLKELQKNLKLSLPTIEIIKAYQGEVPVAQKSLGKVEERIQNAKETMVVVPLDITYKKVLLIDDAVGSGATMNEIAKKLKDRGVKHVVGFAIVGSYKGFEVIKEV
ncbi:MAG: winged helix-turn-helix transcriptional regulator [Bdellovibrio sp.]|nr:winged helix-turn-helix transcriptional regulator [Bdellovibrio sp.]